ncbi:MFS general substrate transporter [Earliella scabrosa]|nr:MFS general substrate transporter [Earliella scabrosa]
MRVMSPDEKHEDDSTPALKHVEQSSTELATSTAVTDLGSKPPPPSDGGLLAEDIRRAAEHRLVRTMDMRLLPTIILIFIMNYVDRLAVTAARLQGLEQDLGLSDIQYQTVLAIVYVSYIPAQIPSNMILNRISRPSYYIPACVVAWGLTSALTGVTHNYSGILTARIFLGIPESAFYPGAIYLLSRWYTRKELSLRGAILYGGLMISNAFGSLMAAGILSGMEGKMGIRAWRWLFYIEGAITVAIGILAVFLLPDYPHNTRWLSPEQRRLAQVRLAEDAGEADVDVATESALKGLLMAIKDPKVALFSLMTFGQLLGASFVNFFPTIAATLGFSTTVTLLLTAPPWILVTVLGCLNAWHADRTGERFLHLSIPMCGTIIAYIIGTTTRSIPGRYIAMFLMASSYIGFSLTLVWVSNVTPRPPAKRSAAIALVNGFGNLGILAGSYVWKASWGPDYHPSMFICIAALGLAIVFAFAIRCLLVRENRRLEREELDGLQGARRERVEEAARLEGITLEEAVRRRGGFRYPL